MNNRKAQDEQALKKLDKETETFMWAVKAAFVTKGKPETYHRAVAITFSDGAKYRKGTFFDS